jgi:hypothetical protein
MLTSAMSLQLGQALSSCGSGNTSQFDAVLARLVEASDVEVSWNLPSSTFTVAFVDLEL